jgi:hypothetical protein
MSKHGFVSKHIRKFNVTTNLDLFHRKVIGLSMLGWITRQLAIDALNMSDKNEFQILKVKSMHGKTYITRQEAKTAIFE